MGDSSGIATCMFKHPSLSQCCNLRHRPSYIRVTREQGSYEFLIVKVGMQTDAHIDIH